MSELTSLKQVIDNLKDSTGRSFFLRTDGIIHNGINIDSTEAIKCIADGKILAMRLTDDYVNIKSLKEDVAFDEEFIAACHLSAHFFNGNIIKDSTKEENSENENKYYFLKRKKNDKKQTSYEYLLNKELKEYDRIEALYFLNEVISNNFVLIEHDLTKLNGDNIKFYSLYNHLAPLGRMTYEQKLNLPWYEHKITMTESKGIAVYRLKNGNIYKSRTLQETMPSSTEFEFDFNEIKTFNKNSPKMPLKVKYISKDESKEGYIYLNENNKYTEKEWNDSIEKFWKVINEEKDTVNFLNFQINVKLKQWVQKNQIVFPNVNNEKSISKILPIYNVATSIIGKINVKAGEKIGYSGFNFMEEDKLDENIVILRDGIPKPYTVHIETFFKNASELEFSYDDDSKWVPFYFKVNNNYSACIEKPTTEGKPSKDTYGMSLIEIIDEEKIYSDEIFYKIKVIAKVRENTNRWVLNGKYTQWLGSVTKKTNKYKSISKKSNSAELFNSSLNYMKNENSTYFYEGFYYLCDGKDNIGNYRRFKYFYDLIDKEYLISSEEFNKLKKENGIAIYSSAKDGKHYFIKSKLDSSNLCSEIHKKEVEKEMISATVETPVKLEYQNKKIYEYIKNFLKEPVDTWYKAKANDKEYWIRKQDIKSEKDGTPVEVISYNDWNKGFEVFHLKNKDEFRIKDYKKLSANNIDEYTKQRQKNIDVLKEFLNNKVYKINDDMIERLVSNTNGGRNIIFEHHNEWDNNKKLVNVYKDSTRLKNEKFEKTLEAYAFMDTVKAKLNKKDVFFYVHPYYFVNRLDKILSVPDFNPYIINGLAYPCRPRLNQDEKNNAIDPIYYFKTNIGFSTAIKEADGYKFLKKLKYIINDTDYYFATLNCPCGYSYAYDEKYADGTKKEHSGIDLPGKSDKVTNASIISFINGEVWGVKWQKSYGNILFVKHKTSSILYLLAHLNTIKVNEGDDIKPGQLVALAGNTGSGGGITHLHLEVFDVGNKNKEEVLKKDKDLGWLITPSDYRRDPLDNTVKYNDLLKETKKRFE